MKKLTYLLVISVFFGTQMFSVPLGFAELSMYRLTVLVLLMGTVLTFINKDDLSHLNHRISFSYSTVFFFWLFYALVSVLWVENLSRWLYGTFFIAFGTISIYFISTYLSSKRDSKRLIMIVFVMTLMHQLIGWIELLFNTYFWADLNYIDKYNQFDKSITERVPISIFQNINDYATLILFSIFIALIVLFTSKHLLLKFISLFMIGSGSFFIFQAGSRGNQLGLIVGLFALALVKIMDLSISRKIFMTAGVLAGLFVIAVILSPAIRNFTSETISMIIETQFREGYSNRYRVHLILNSLYFLGVTFGFGVGAGNLEHWMTNHAIYEVDARNVHNWFIEILAGYGIVTFVLYTLMYFYMMRKLYNNFKYSNNSYIQKVSWVLLSYLFAFLFSSISSASNIIIEWQWISWGVIIAFIKYSDEHAKIT
ncbi:O-antigen ligase family protein [Alkalibacterium kapii]|uniref:Teichuronic acid biosynthesis protein TuaE n=1 Tax=Alkalibacterium kapii TaxID=426704 RepID=A0A511ASH6_9LACT|nr:O-antigen ligase family protein [Alkalibacterium kapii]GEK91056.1 teichuronic acid biosynthesis protein TuaE [Alkalibacterium kapii]